MRVIGSRLTSLASRASQLPPVRGVVYDPHHYQFLARYYETPTSQVPVTKRFPLRRWGFQKSFRFACDAVQQAFKPGEFDESEIAQVEETTPVGLNFHMSLHVSLSHYFFLSFSFRVSSSIFLYFLITFGLFVFGKHFHWLYIFL